MAWLRAESAVESDKRSSTGESVTPRRATLDGIRRGLEAAGVEFLGEDGSKVGVRFKAKRSGAAGGKPEPLSGRPAHEGGELVEGCAHEHVTAISPASAATMPM
jgi:hypothetical protein